MNNKFINKEDLPKIKEKFKSKIVVLTSGCFDLIHQGHIYHLKESKKQGDILIVALNSDQSIKKLKGEKRPILDQNQRIEILSSMCWCDYICLFDERDIVEIIYLLKPDVFCIGEESVINFPQEITAAKKNNCSISIIKRKKEFSSSLLIQKIKDSLL